MTDRIRPRTLATPSTNGGRLGSVVISVRGKTSRTSEEGNA